MSAAPRGNGHSRSNGDGRALPAATATQTARSRDSRGGQSGDGAVLITGGAGFIGANLADRLAREGHDVLVFDNLSRPGVERNLHWLCGRHGSRIRAIRGDVRDAGAVERAVRQARQIYHLAAQVAVTSSLDDPRFDCDVNILGTINVLEAARRSPRPPSVLFTSTNKVYGNLCDVPLRATGTRYEPSDPALRRSGIAESRALDFHSPYGCSKGAADQYVLDYARCFGLSAAVFRMSCIYGRRQMGTEDQGWVAHFILRMLAGQPITIYGDGLQVRDILFADDLVEALLAAQRRMPALSGRAFNIGGGPDCTTSLVELLRLLERLEGKPPAVNWDDWRTGDQRYYVSDTSRFRRATGWSPAFDVQRGVRELYGWLKREWPELRRVVGGVASSAGPSGLKPGRGRREREGERARRRRPADEPSAARPIKLARAESGAA